ncbi:MAG: alkaline phosphatase D family protein, partial [Cyclobacteriaceae bacterium]
PEYWANPMQDWFLNRGRIECVASGGNRNVFLLTHELDSSAGDFRMNVDFGAASWETLADTGWVGFKVGIRGEFKDYRDNAVRGDGFPAGITTDGRLFIGEVDQQTIPIEKELDFVNLSLEATASSNNYLLKLSVSDGDGKLLSTIEKTDIHPDWLAGGLALVCHSGKLPEVNGARNPIDYPDWGFIPGTARGGDVKFWFSEWELSGSKVRHNPERAWGPILFAQHTLSDNTLKMTAQLVPGGGDEGKEVVFQTRTREGWATVAEAPVDPDARTATFKISDWDSKKDIDYRLSYSAWTTGGTPGDHYYEGTIKKEPWEKEELVIAAFTGNNDLGFPNSDLVDNVKKQDPDFLFFSGDQIYEGVGGYGIQITPIEKAYLDYLRKWYLYGWAYNDLLKNTPVVAIPDDHDVYHGNIWGAGGIAAPKAATAYEAQDEGGYKMPASWVNMVQRTQTSHLPDPYDPTPAEQDIGVYYCNLNYGGVSFAILEDRKFKSAPKELLPEGKIENGWPQNRDFDPKTQADHPEAKLLGDRQLAFLRNWAADWSEGVWMKVVLSQTIFANVATLPKEDAYHDKIVPNLRIMKADEYAPDDVPVSDMDSNGWPQTGRDKALQELRKCFALHIAGDQHLGSTIQYGIDEYGDAGYAICVPSVSNVWPRRWYPSAAGLGAKPGSPRYAGDYEDGFGNKMTVFAVSNPVYTGREPAKLYDRATGYGIVKIEKATRDITMANWPRDADPGNDEPYPEWPITINQQDNYGRAATAFLPEIRVTGLKAPVVQVIDQQNNEIVYTLRMNRQKLKPKVFKNGLYTLRVGEQGTDQMKTFTDIRTIASVKDAKVLEVAF